MGQIIWNGLNIQVVAKFPKESIKRGSDHQLQCRGEGCLTRGSQCTIKQRTVDQNTHTEHTAGCSQLDAILTVCTGDNTDSTGKGLSPTTPSPLQTSCKPRLLPVAHLTHHLQTASSPDPLLVFN